MIRQVGGDGVHVTSLFGPNGDPHAFEPTPQDARRLKAADIVFVNGLGLEGWMDRLISASGYEGAVIVASDATQNRLAEENGKQILDPMFGTAPPTASSMFKTSSKLYRSPTLQMPRNTRPTASGMQTSWARSTPMPAMQ
jgi:ABC-type Zn uptake system ZnuABC Zn-binding protein ZnuA